MNTRTNHGAIVPIERIEADPYAELKKAHAEGKVIQWKFKDAEGWMDKIANFDEYPANCDFRIKPDKIPWIEWHGGPCPLKDEEVEEWEYKMRNEITQKCEYPFSRRWNHLLVATDIIAYRVLKWREKKPKVPLGPEDVPPGSVFRPIHWGEGPEWLLVTRVHSTECEIAGEASSWSRLRQYFQINRSIPLTGKWNPDAWEPCEK
jgi:hypothetical protein